MGLPSIFACMVAVGVIIAADASAAQQPPPVHGVTGTIATEGTIEDTSEAAHSILMKAADVVVHLFHLNRRSAVHSGDAAGDEALRALKKGTPVVVHDTTEGENSSCTAFRREELRRRSPRVEVGSESSYSLHNHSAYST